jgi:hypothetical protein
LKARVAASWEDALIEIRLEGEMNWNATHFRISPLGQRVRSGKFEAAFRRAYFRWVGGRLITNHRSAQQEWGQLRVAPN